MIGFFSPHRLREAPVSPRLGKLLKRLKGKADEERQKAQPGARVEATGEVNFTGTNEGTHREPSDQHGSLLSHRAMLERTLTNATSDSLTHWCSWLECHDGNMLSPTIVLLVATLALSHVSKTVNSSSPAISCTGIGTARGAESQGADAKSDSAFPGKSWRDRFRMKNPKIGLYFSHWL